MSNIFDYKYEDDLDMPATQISKESAATKNSETGVLAGVIGSGLFLLICVTALPIYFHLLTKVAVWSWNLI